MDERNQLLRMLPSVDAVLGQADVQLLLNEHTRVLLAGGVRRAIEARRVDLLAGATQLTAIEAGDVERAILIWTRSTLRTVINATGIMLHTNLGRAPMPESALERIADVCGGYSNLEMNLATGKRGSRMDLVRSVLLELTGAEAALVVNNNAAAVYLALRTLAAGREVVVSRGELVEIGGSFRVPDVMAASGSILREVGTTNRTRLADYERAIGPETGLILKVHRSNFEIVGFTEDAPLDKLAVLAREHRLPLVMDMGSGTLLERPPKEVGGYRVRDVLEQGPDLVCFSGDKLLGGPQAGILLGSAQLVDRLAADPMARALRVDKLTLAALEACLNLYRGGDQGARRIPVVEMLLSAPADLRDRAERLAEMIRKGVIAVSVEVVSSEAQVGGGSLPLSAFGSFAVAVSPRDKDVVTLTERLRAGRPAVLGRVVQDRLLLDVRTLLGDEQLSILVKALGDAASSADP